MNTQPINEPGLQKILIIDDCVQVGRLLERSLGGEGIKVTSFQSPRQAIRFAHLWRPHIILLDVQMHDIDGIACLAQIRAEPALRHTPVIMMSGRTTNDMVREAARHGVDGFLVKNADTITTLRGRIAAA